jgi:SAM-dependent methyltransferase
MSDNLPQHVSVNRSYWDAMADDWVASGERNWSESTPTWGIWGVPEEEVDMLPDTMMGLRAIELGCGTGYVSAWMRRLGAEVVGVDNSHRQLSTARRLMQEHGLDITFLHGNAEEVPLPDNSFDFAVSEYGAAIWCDPHRWIAEAHRLLVPGGELRFMGTHPFVNVSSPQSGSPVDEQLHRDYFSMHAIDWQDVDLDPGGIEFNLPISEWFSLFDRVGFDVVRFIEPRVPPGVDEDRFGIPVSWARRWPTEQVWHLRRRPAGQVSSQ